MAADDDQRPIRRGDVRALWGIAVVIIVIAGAWFTARNDVSALERRMDSVERAVEGHGILLRSISESVARIEGRLGIEKPR